MSIFCIRTMAEPSQSATQVAAPLVKCSGLMLNLDILFGNCSDFV